ncbi:hypothetical protein SteCoe_24335 [Stentor coeruleus]|uniref:Kelch motif family protein n=1 Tax=Stentor coeruleus TaxID=5963 RepID=A0A1R2BHU5_9CILI|nr:hypothetical protein SteCoe_24335 [Stentor coeruleus]
MTTKLRCFYLNCLKFPSKIVFCGKNLLICCQKHEEMHIQNCSTQHQVRPLVKKVNKAAKMKMIQTLKRELYKNRKDSEKFSEVYNKLVKNLSKLNSQAIQKYKFYQEFCEGMLKNALNDRVPLMFTGDITMENDISSESLKEDVNFFWQSFISNTVGFDLNISSLFEETEKCFKQFLHKEFKCVSTETILSRNSIVEPEPVEPEDPNELLDQHLYFFKQNTKKLIEFDTLQLNYKATQVSVYENQGYCQSICCIPRKRLFISSGRIGCNTYLDTTYIINLETKQVESLPKYKQRAHAQATLYNNKIYIFGGSNGKLVNFSSSFDLNSRTWNTLSNLPAPVGNTSTLLLGNEEIFIAGYLNFIGTFNTKSNSYQCFDANINTLIISLVIRDNDKIYLLSGDLYMCSADNFTDWQSGSKSLSFYSTSSRPVYRGRKVYFSDWKNFVYEFDLDMLELKKVVKIN